MTRMHNTENDVYVAKVLTDMSSSTRAQEEVEGILDEKRSKQSKKVLECAGATMSF